MLSYEVYLRHNSDTWQENTYRYCFGWDDKDGEKDNRREDMFDGDRDMWLIRKDIRGLNIRL